ncbi:hypothetical protein RI367_005246 [Sorochytrium milnesiophthora]
MSIVEYDAAVHDEYLRSLNQHQQRTIADKYFARSYFTPVDKDTKEQLGEDQAVLQVPNKLCVIALSERHRIFEHLANHPEHSVVAVNFSDAITSANVSGKRKRNAAHIHPYTIVATVLCGRVGADEVTFQMRGCVRGQVLEWNERLQRTPDLLVKSPLSEGWLIVVKPNKEELHGMTDKVAYDAAKTSL